MLVLRQNQGEQRKSCVPEIEIVDAALGIAHVDVEAEQIDRRFCLATQDFVEIWQAVALDSDVGRGSSVRHGCEE